MSKVIVGTGSDLPAWQISNDELEAMGVGFDRSRSGKTLDQWSMERMGVRTRHRIRPGEGTSDMGARAAQRALEDAQLKARDLGLIVMSTFSSDHRTPTSAALVQSKLGASCKALQVDAACSGFVEATTTAAALMDLMAVEYALVVSSDANSQYAAPDDFMWQCLCGDGGGAIVLQNRPGSAYGLKAFHMGGDGSAAEKLWVPGGGTKEPVSETMMAAKRQYAHWAYKEVYSFAVQKVVESSQIVADAAGWQMDDVAWFIPHQAGRNILLDAIRRLEQPVEKLILNMEHAGNTSGASIPLALDEANRAGRFRDGDKLIMPAMGAGLAWGALAFVWHDYAHGRRNGSTS